MLQGTVGHPLDISASLKNAGQRWKTIFAIVLVLFILFGFATKLMISSNLGLNSDMVGEGLQSMEIWKHQNYLLGGYYLPSEDTFIFTELLPFQLIPQILTNFDPLALKLVSYVIFVLAVAALSYVVYLVSGETICALLFAALAANLPPNGYAFFDFPTTHIATMIFTGIIFALLLYMGASEKTADSKAKKGKKKQAALSNTQWAYLAGLALLVAITVLSDTIVLTWLIIPYILAYLVFFKGKNRALNMAIACMALVSVICYIFKTYFVQNWARQAMVSRDISGILSINLPLSYKSLAILLNQGLYQVADGFTGFGLLEALSLIVFILLVAYAVKNALGDKKKWFFYSILLISGIFMFATFLMTVRVKDLSQARYFTFMALSVFMLIAISYRREDKVYNALVVSMLVISAIYGFTFVTTQLHAPNVQENGLISFLKQNDLTWGYATYWDANVITYLSDEGVTVRAVHFLPDGVESDTLLSDEQWYQSPPAKTFILVDNSSLDEVDRAVVQSMTRSVNYSDILHYGNYDIYRFNRAKS